MSENKSNFGNYAWGFFVGAVTTFISMKDNGTDAVQNLKLGSPPIVEQHCTIDSSGKPINCHSDTVAYKVAADKFKIK